MRAFVVSCEFKRSKFCRGSRRLLTLKSLASRSFIFSTGMRTPEADTYHTMEYVYANII